MKNFFIIFIAFFLNFLVSAQEFTGSAYHKNFTFKEYLAQPQNWSVIQDNRGVMYFANTGGILEYDGTDWKLIYIEKNSAILSLAIDNKNRIYVGGQGVFGYLTPDQTGKLIYISLSSRLDSSKLKYLENIWTIIVKNDEIYFRTRKGIFQFSPYANKDSIFDDSQKTLEKIKVFNPNIKIKGFCANEKDIYIRAVDGLYKKVNDDFQKIPNSDFFIKNQIYDIHNYHSDKLLIATKEKIVIFNPKDTTNLITDLEDLNADQNISKTPIIKENNINIFKKIPHERFFVGTKKGGAVIIDKNGKILDFFNTDNLLVDNSVWAYLYKDNISWLALNLGISKIETNSAFRFWKKKYNIEGPIISIIEHDSILYVSNYNDVYYLELNKINKKAEHIKFKKISNNLRGVWNFKKFSLNGKKKILLAVKSNAFCEIKKDKIINIFPNLSCKEFSISKNYKNALFIGTKENLSLIKYKNGKWEKEKIKNIKGEIISIEEEKNGNIWLTTYFNGVFYLKKKTNVKNLPISEQYELCHYDETNGLPSIRLNSVYEIDNQIFFSTRKGFYEFDKAKEMFFASEKLNYFKTAINTVVKMKNGSLWIDGRKILKKQNNGNYLLDTTFSKRLPIMLMTSMYEMNDDVFLFGAVDGLYAYDRRNDNRNIVNYKALVRKVICGKDSILFNGTNYKTENDSVFTTTLEQNTELKPVLNYENNSLIFTYSATFYEAQDKIRYSYQLEGFDENWANWTEETKKEYTNLHEGKYIFKVRAKNVYKHQSTVASYEFEILPPWHRTKLAYFIYLILGFIFVFIVVKLYTKRLKAQNIALENIVIERTKEISKRNEELKKQKEQILNKNVELEQQKEEILTQAEELQDVNVELEKLSIVASETDNAVLIFDKDFNLEWVNYGFTKIYGYTFYEFVNDRDVNLLSNSNYENIENIINQCIENQKSFIYENKNKTKDGLVIWVQTTLTPIFDENENLLKFIALETNISEIKNAHERIFLQNKEISLKNTLITSSITYAQTIQKAILPIDENMKKYFDFFTLFRPKDIVSGDFYWFTELKLENKFFIFIAVVDCTGHGVPGAFMSMIGSRLLSEIVKEKKVINTAEILELLDIGIKKSLKQEQTENNDGMDLCLCRFEKTENEINMNFSGAKRPLFIFRNESNEIEIFKADRRSIGGAKEKRKKLFFINQETSLKKEDIVYLTTDGYIDQNNSERKRFGTKQFFEILQNNANNSLTEQKNILEKELDNWQKNESQRDDITIMGIKNIKL